MLICIEGINGAGKSTVLAALEKSLALEGHLPTEEPMQATSFGTSIRRAIMDEPELDPHAEALAFASGRLQFAAEMVRGSAPPVLAIERWAGAVEAYEPGGPAAPTAMWLEELLWSALQFDVVCLVDVPGKVAHDRLSQLSSGNRFETRGPEYLEQVRRRYRKWAERRQVPIYDGNQTAEEIAESIISHFPKPIS